MAVVAARNGHNVRIYARNMDTVISINENHRNDRYLTDFDLPESLVAVNSVLEAMEVRSYTSYRYSSHIIIIIILLENKTYKFRE